MDGEDGDGEVVGAVEGCLREEEERGLVTQLAGGEGDSPSAIAEDGVSVPVVAIQGTGGWEIGLGDEHVGGGGRLGVAERYFALGGKVDGSSGRSWSRWIGESRRSGCGSRRRGREVESE